MKKVVRVVVRLKGQTALAKVSQARFTVNKMQGNLNFPTLAAQVTALGSATDTLESAILGAFTGDHEKVAEKQLAEEAVMEGLTALCASINGVAPNDKAKLITCGLPLQKDSQPAGELDPTDQVGEPPHQHQQPRVTAVGRTGRFTFVQRAHEHHQRAVQVDADRFHHEAALQR